MSTAPNLRSVSLQSERILFILYIKYILSDHNDCQSHLVLRILTLKRIYKLIFESINVNKIPTALKGTVSPLQICLKVVWFIRPRLGYVTLDIKQIFYSPFNFVLSVEVLMRPTLNTYQLTFSQEVDKCCCKPTQNFHLTLTNCSGCSPRCFRKPEGAAISSYKHWWISPQSLVMW